MKNKKEIQDELSSISPMLSKMKQEKEDPFRVPHNYFEQLPDDIMRRLKAEEAPEPVAAQGVSWIDKVLESLAVLFQPRMAVAFASMALLIVAAFFFLQSPGEEIPSLAAEQEEISEQEIAAYIEANIDEFDAELLFAESYAQSEDSPENTLEEEDEDLDEYMDDLIDELDESELEQLL